MSGPLASLFSTIDSLKRGAGDAVRNPYQTFENFVNQKNQDAGEHLKLLQAARGPGEAATPENTAALNKVITALAEGYNPGGIMAGLASKTLPAKELVEASQMARKGADPAEIWWKTGFGKSFDGHWRYEIPDDKINVRLKEVLNDPYDSWRTDKFKSASENIQGIPELFAAYPTLDTIAVNAGTINPRYMPGQGNGYYSAGQAPTHKGGEIFGAANNADELASIVRHELQHAVQRKQAWQGGANPEMFMPKPYLFGSQTAPQEMKREAYNKYLRAAGEAEARLVQARGRMTPEMRREIFPFDPISFAAHTGVAPEALLSQRDIARMVNDPFKP